MNGVALIACAMLLLLISACATPSAPLRSVTVWYYVVTGPTLTFPTQVIDNFPTRTACNRHRTTLVQYLRAGPPSEEGRVAPCRPRDIVEGKR